jgi:hypothetical protein
VDLLMQDTVPSKSVARVITIRIRGRLTALFGVLLLVTLLPFLAASTPRHASVLLAAGAPQPAASNDAPADDPALGGGPALAPPVGDAINPLAPGTNLFLFPTLQLPPSVSAEAMAAAVHGPTGFIWPIRGPESSGFGPRIHPVLGRAMFHTGVDLVVACGTPIRAAAAGQVVYAAITPSWGRRVIIQHTPGLETGYAHMSRFLVQSGDTVKQGDIIGLVGTTGWSTGCHLHFDVIVDGQYVDPAPYLGLPPSTTARIPYYAAPHLVLDDSGTVVHTVEDGDVPIPPDPATTAPAKATSPSAPEPTPSSTPPTSKPTATPTTTSAPTATPTTSAPTATPTTSQPTPSPTDTHTTGTPTTPGPTTSPTDTPSTEPTTTSTQTTGTATSTTTPTSTETSTSPATSTAAPNPSESSTTEPTPSETAPASGTTTTSDEPAHDGTTSSSSTSAATTLATEPRPRGTAETGSEPSTG